MDTQLFQKAYALIKSANNILIATHEQPDGDALASACLMAEILSLLNKKYSLYCHSEVNNQYDFLPHLDELKNNLENFNFDLIIVLDCGTVERTKLDKEILNRQPNQPVLEIDHHPKIKNYADFLCRPWRPTKCTVKIVESDTSIQVEERTKKKRKVYMLHFVQLFG